MHTRLTAAAITAAALLALTACSASDSTKSAADTAPTATVSIDTDLSKEILESAAANAGIPPEPTGQQRDDYLAAVRAIAPALADTEMYSDASLLSLGRDACQLMHQTTTDAGRLSNAQAALSSSIWSATSGQAQQLIDAAHEDICPSY